MSGRPGMRASPQTQQHLGLLAATGVGVGAIVGSGILALAGVAFATTGPSAILAFALNGVIAMITVCSFAELAARFPQSGGTYTYARKVLTVEAAFGWGGWCGSPRWWVRCSTPWASRSSWSRSWSRSL